MLFLTGLDRYKHLSNYCIIKGQANSVLNPIQKYFYFTYGTLWCQQIYIVEVAEIFTCAMSL